MSELVTEEMVAAAALAYRQTYRVADATGVFPTHEDCVAAALNAVAPMIAKRAVGGLTSHDVWRAVAAERERVVRVLSMLAAKSEDNMEHGGILSCIDAICAGETP